MKRTIAIPLLLLVFTWPVESALAATAMGSAHDCCKPKAVAPASCHEQNMHSIRPVVSAQHSHDQCPMGCCSKRQASGGAIIASALQLRSIAVESQQVVVRSREARARLAVNTHFERGPPLLV